MEYKGEFHDIHLINFSVDPEEIKDQVPHPLQMRLINGRAMISMMDVQIRNFHPAMVPGILTLNYQHVALRLLIEDSAYNWEGVSKGAYTLRSFSEKPGRSFLTPHYNVEGARFINVARGLDVKAGDNLVSFILYGPDPDPNSHQELAQITRDLDRDYHADAYGAVKRVKTVRDDWNMQPMLAHNFICSYFKTAQLEAVFNVPSRTPFRFLNEEMVNPLSDQERERLRKLNENQGRKVKTAERKKKVVWTREEVAEKVY